MQPPMPSPTTTWHNDIYDAISPTRPELSAKGKVVIIIGAGSGIGRSTAQAFDAAGASKIILSGRNEEALQGTASLLSAPSMLHVGDVTRAQDLQRLASAAGQWDVLILSAGYIASPVPVVQSDIDEWWQSFETNVKGTMLAVKTLLPTANQTHASILGLTAGASTMPLAYVPGLSAYISSKLAQIKFFEFVASENPRVFAATVHPGIVETALLLKSGSDPKKVPTDSIHLPAHFMVWLTSPEGRFLSGRSVWANWDVNELKLQAQDIQAGLKMTSGVQWWPY